MTEPTENKLNDKKDRLVVYTALFGDYDDLIDPPEKFEGCDFVCFTDQKHLKSDIWDIRLVEDCDLPPNMMNRRYKIFPHFYFSEYERSLYVDASVAIKKDPSKLANKYLEKFNIAIPQHYARNCVYDEAEVLVSLNKAPYDVVENQINSYKDHGFPSNYGLTENGVIFRTHNIDEVIKLMESWWSELHTFSQRDQLSLPFLAWKQKITIKAMPETARGGRYFSLIPHRSVKHNGTFGWLFRRRAIYLVNHPNSFLFKLDFAIKKIFRK
jgi:hypothetical protein